MAGKDKTLRKMSRSELIDVIHDMQKEPEPVEEIPDEESVREERARLKQRKLFFRTFRSTVYAMLVVAAVAVLIATLLMPVLQVSGTSMEPTLEDGDIVVLSKIGDFETGDLCGLYWQNKLLIKRVIATPGDVVDIDSHGVVSVNGQTIDEPYVDKLSLGQCDITLPYQVPENRYFVMGDHRETSIDSRTSAVGCIERDQVVGRILLRVYPLDSISLVK